MIPEDVELRDAILFVYEEAMQCNVLDKGEVLLRGVELLCIPDEKVGAPGNLSRNMVTVKMTEEVNENSGIDIRPSYWKDAPTEKD